MAAPVLLSFLALLIGGCAGAAGNDPPALPTVSLSWDPPALDVNGDPLNGSIGFKVYYGTSPGASQAVKDVGPFTSCVLDLPSSGTWYFAVTAYNRLDLESDRSEEVSAFIEE